MTNMQVVKTIAELRHKLKESKAEFKQPNKQAAIGFVPTLGFLHEGHASLLNRARTECSIVVLSVFVNPTQFGPNEDFARYPRDTERDLALAERSGVDFVFLPDTAEMYPRPPKTKVVVSELTDRLCGSTRPGHFDGVASVVAKLFHIVQPDRAYFGLKDAQQVAVIQQMTADLNIPVTIVPCPTLREQDGLAMSSRNVYLTPDQRQQALVLSQSLQRTKEWVQDVGLDANALIHKITDKIQTAPLAAIEYVDVLMYPSLVTLEEWKSTIGSPDSQLLIALAVKFGNTRLIDNILIDLKHIHFVKEGTTHV